MTSMIFLDLSTNTTGGVVEIFTPLHFVQKLSITLSKCVSVDKKVIHNSMKACHIFTGKSCLVAGERRPSWLFRQIFL